MNRNQEKILDLTKELHNICISNGITYYLACGSCLGALRNQGFLPWDDDIDIVMTRDNFEKLYNLPLEKFPLNRVIVGKKNVPGYHEEPYRYTSTEDTSIQRTTMHYDCPKGSYVDILILDPMPKGKKEKERYLEKLCIYFELSNQVYVTDTRGYRFSPRKYLRLKKLEKFLGTDFFLKKYEKYLQSFLDKECDSYAARWQGTIALSFDKNLFGKMRMVPFEDTFLSVPEKAESYLRRTFGDDWMMEPEKAEGTHIILNDEELPYYIYVEDYMQHLDRDKWAEKLRLIKNLKVEVLEDKQINNILAHKLDGIRIRLKIERMLAEYSIDLEQLIQAGKYDEIEKIYQEYILRQFSAPDGGYTYWKLFLELPDELLYPIFYCIIVNHNYVKVKKVLDWRKQQKKEKLSDDLQRLEELLGILNKVSVALYDEHNIEKAEWLVQNCQWKEFPLLKAVTVYAAIQKSTKEQLNVIKQEVESLMKANPKLLEIEYCMAEVCYRQKDYKRTLYYYNEIIAKSKNAILKQRCKKGKKEIIDILGNE